MFFNNDILLYLIAYKYCNSYFVVYLQSDNCNIYMQIYCNIYMRNILQYKCIVMMTITIHLYCNIHHFLIFQLITYIFYLIIYIFLVFLQHLTNNLLHFIIYSIINLNSVTEVE